jgi:hypothetical protein
MEDIKGKERFLKEEYTSKLAALDPNAQRLWGKMNVQQMIEHMSDYVRIGCGKTSMEIVTPEEHLPKMQAFLMTEKPFRENTPNPLMPDEPTAVRHADIKDSIAELQAEIDNFFETFKNNPGLKAIHPFFGSLDQNMSVQVLHKHAWHHLRQFGITE